VQVLNALYCVLAQCRDLLCADSVCEILSIIVQIHATHLVQYHDELLQLSVTATHPLSTFIDKILDLVRTTNRNDDDDDETPCVWQLHFERVYQRIDDELKRGHGQYLFAALLFYCNSFITQHMNVIVPIFEQITDERQSETIRFAVLSILFALLRQVPNGATDVIGEHILVDVLLPNLVWKPGSFHYRMRELAVRCMLMVYEKHCIDSSVSWKYKEKLICLVQSRFDDFQSELRVLVMQLMRYILEDVHKASSLQLHHEPAASMMKDAEWKSLCTNILERFDDSQDDVRVLCCATLKVFVQCMQSQQAHLYPQIIATALLHLDDSNDVLQREIFEFLQFVVACAPQEVEKQINMMNLENVQESTSEFVKNLLTLIQN